MQWEFYPVFTDTDKKVDSGHDELSVSKPSKVSAESKRGAVEQRFRACSFQHPVPFLRLAGGERQPGQIFREQIATLGD
ncbi:hypothetical protein TP47_06775 [Xanthomonas citri pv. aurantifolii]|nr:hypothetical protein TP37_05585 [Xanthomonas citri pv. aurantifolii]OQP83079.1 hypothetical protein IB69_019065 [Xanthomonas citri]SOO18416.1 conserved hypothetical protein [Xanthomonas citri pv. fuscans]AMV02375.1 hypothetical protein TP50_07965 [Xanthomonas citri pv. aurantifolii]AMV05654.1 hypothetical protein AC028_01475 [Xanthomonas citri pv. aurantifolii]